MATGLPEPEEPEEPSKPDEPEEPHKPEETEEAEIDRTGLSRTTKVLSSRKNDEFSSFTRWNFKPLKAGIDYFD